MEISRARKLLGKKGETMTDEEIMAVEDKLRQIANIVIDRVLEMSPEERKAIDKKIMKK